MIEYYALSDVGLRRKNNQDSYLSIENKNGDFLGMVCDGIGGGKAGDVASGEVVKYFKDKFENAKAFKNDNNMIDFLKKELTEVNKKIFDLGNKYADLSGMGTTATGVLINEKETVVFNVGDSRVYGIKNNEIYQLTVDHTYVNQMIKMGKMTYEESLNHPKRHYLIRAIGVFEKIEYDINPVDKMDYYLICSDGLSAYSSEKEILKIMNDDNLKSCKDKCEELLKLALFKGGYDNITVVVVKI